MGRVEGLGTRLSHGTENPPSVCGKGTDGGRGVDEISVSNIHGVHINS